jgi:hypothetical protein
VHCRACESILDVGTLRRLGTLATSCRAGLRARLVQLTLALSHSGALVVSTSSVAFARSTGTARGRDDDTSRTGLLAAELPVPLRLPTRALATYSDSRRRARLARCPCSPPSCSRTDEVRLDRLLCRRDEGRNALYLQKERLPKPLVPLTGTEIRWTRMEIR